MGHHLCNTNRYIEELTSTLLLHNRHVLHVHYVQRVHNHTKYSMSVHYNNSACTAIIMIQVLVLSVRGTNS